MRNEKGMLLRQLSAELCVNSTYISKIERGERNCNGEFVNKIVIEFNTNFDDLIVLWLVEKIANLEREEPLARKDSGLLMNALLNPPKPSERLRKKLLSSKTKKSTN